MLDSEAGGKRARRDACTARARLLGPRTTSRTHRQADSTHTHPVNFEAARHTLIAPASVTTQVC